MSEKEKSKKVIHSISIGILASMASIAAISGTASAAETDELMEQNIESAATGTEAASENAPVIETLNNAGNLLNKAQAEVSASMVGNAKDIQGGLHGAADALGQVEGSVAEVERANSRANDALEDYEEAVTPNASRNAAGENIRDFAAAKNSSASESTGEDEEQLEQTAGDSAAYIKDQKLRLASALMSVQSATKEAGAALDAAVNNPAADQALSEAGEALGAAQESGSSQVSGSVEKAYGGVQEVVQALPDLTAVTEYDQDAYDQMAARYDEDISAYENAVGSTAGEEGETTRTQKVTTDYGTGTVEVTAHAPETTSDGKTETTVQKTDITGTVTGEEPENAEETRRIVDLVKGLPDGAVPEVAGYQVSVERDGSGAVTGITLTREESASAPLTIPQLETVLGMSIRESVGEDGSVTYTCGENDRYTLTIDRDDSAAVTTVTWTVQQYGVSADARSVDQQAGTEGALVADALAKAEDSGGADTVVKTDDLGRIVSAVVTGDDGTTIYTFHYKPVADSFKNNLTNEKLFALLGGTENTAGVTWDGENLYDKDGYLLIYDAERSQFSDTIVLRVQPNGTELTQEQAGEAARQAAVLAAAKASYGAELPDGVVPVKGEDGLWTVRFTTDEGLTYTTIRVEITDESADQGTATAKAIASDCTVTAAETGAVIDQGGVRITVGEDGKLYLVKDGKEPSLLEQVGDVYRNAKDDSDSQYYEIAALTADQVVGFLTDRGYAVGIDQVDLEKCTAVCVKDNVTVTVSFDKYGVVRVWPPGNSIQSVEHVEDSAANPEKDPKPSEESLRTIAEGLLEYMRTLEEGKEVSWDGGKTFHTLAELKATAQNDGELTAEQLQAELVALLTSEFKEDEESSNWLTPGTVVNFQDMTQDELKNWLLAERESARNRDFDLNSLTWINQVPDGWEAYYHYDENHSVLLTPSHVGDHGATWSFEDPYTHETVYVYRDVSKPVNKETGYNWLDFTNPNQVEWRIKDKYVYSDATKVNCQWLKETSANMVQVYVAEDGQRFRAERSGDYMKYTDDSGVQHTLDMRKDADQEELARIQWVLPDYAAKKQVGHTDLGFQGMIDLGNGKEAHCAILAESLQIILGEVGKADLDDVITASADNKYNAGKAGIRTSGVTSENNAAIQDKNTGFFEYELHDTISETEKHISSDEFFQVSGYVAYGALLGEDKKPRQFNSENDAELAAAEAGITTPYIVAISYAGKTDELRYYVYKNTAPIKVFGYMTESYNACANIYNDPCGYDFAVRDLVLSDGVVSAKVPGARTWNLNTITRAIEQSGPAVTVQSFQAEAAESYCYEVSAGMFSGVAAFWQVEGTQKAEQDIDVELTLTETKDVEVPPADDSVPDAPVVPDDPVPDVPVVPIDNEEVPRAENPEPTTIEDEVVPLEEAPEETPEAETPEVTIEEEGTPQSETPLVEIEDELTPLAAVPKTGVNTVWAVMAAASAIGLGLIGVAAGLLKLFRRRP